MDEELERIANELKRIARRLYDGTRLTYDERRDLAARLDSLAETIGVEAGR